MIDAAAIVFAEKGYMTALTKDIADHLGIRQASIYYYFKSKEEALERVCEIGMEGFLEAIVGIARKECSASEKIRLVILWHIPPMSDRYAYTKVFLTDRQYLPDEPRKAIAQMARTYEATVKEIFEQGIADKEFSPDLDSTYVTKGLLGMCNSVITWYKPGSGYDIDSIAETYCRLILDGCKTR